MDARTIWGFVVAAVLALSLPNSAHAGFGRRGGSGGGSHSSGGGSHSSGGGGGGRAVVHTAPSPSRTSAPPARSWGSSSTYRPSSSGRGWSSGPGYRPLRWSPGYNVWGYGGPVLLPPPVVVVPPAYVVDAEAPPPVQPYDERPPGPVTTLGGDLTLGAGNLQLAGAQLAVEGRRLGVVFAYTAAFAPIAGTDARDTLHLAQARFTYALISGPQARLRLELGGHLAAAPDATFFAPGIGVSAAVHLVGPLGLEGRVYGNAWPYTQVDARAGLSIAAGGVGASVGFRALYLNDNGALGAVNAGNTSDFFYGPCVLLAFAL